MAEVYSYRLKKYSKDGFSLKWMYNEKLFFIFLQILSYAKKIKKRTFARMNNFIENKKLTLHISFFHCSGKCVNPPDLCHSLKRKKFINMTN